MGKVEKKDAKKQNVLKLNSVLYTKAKDSKLKRKIAKRISTSLDAYTSSAPKVDAGTIKLTNAQIFNAIEALQKVRSDDKKKKLLETEEPIFVHVVAVKVPQTPPRTLRVLLPNSKFDNLSEICFIAKNADNRDRKNVDKTVESVEQLLKSHKINSIKTILPLYQLVTEYDQFEMKRRLVELYDLFLVDSSISKTVTQFLGKIFIEKHKNPTPVRMNKKNLPEEFDRCIRKASMSIHSRGDDFPCEIGHDKMEKAQLVENIHTFIQEIQREFPGGSKNIKSFFIKTAHSTSVPLYVSLANSNNFPDIMETPILPKRHKVYTDELSTFQNADVSVYPDGTTELIMSKDPSLQDDLEKTQIMGESEALDELKPSPQKKKHNLRQRKKILENLNVVNVSEGKPKPGKANKGKPKVKKTNSKANKTESKTSNIDLKTTEQVKANTAKPKANKANKGKSKAAKDETGSNIVIKEKTDTKVKATKKVEEASGSKLSAKKRAKGVKQVPSSPVQNGKPAVNKRKAAKSAEDKPKKVKLPKSVSNKENRNDEDIKAKKPAGKGRNAKKT